MSLIASQTIFYTALNGNVSAGVYDETPFLPEGAVDSDFPFVYIGDATARRFDNDSFVGQGVRQMVHVWSRYPGMKEVKELMKEIDDIMNRGSFTLAGYNVVDCLSFSSSVSLDPDGKTRHGILGYNLTIQETS